MHWWWKVLEEVHNRLHDGPPLTILSQLNPAHYHPSSLMCNYFSINTNSMYRPPKLSLSLTFLLFSFPCVPHVSPIPSFFMRSTEGCLVSSTNQDAPSQAVFSKPLRHFLTIRLRYLPQHPIFENPRPIFLCVSLNMGDQVSHPYNTTSISGYFNL